MTDRYFAKQTFGFLSVLVANNKREWFDEHQQDCVIINRRRATTSDIRPDELSPKAALGKLYKLKKMF